MPESKARHSHKHPQHHNAASNNHPKTKKTPRIVIVAAIFFALLGLGISYFLNAASVGSLLAGAAIGGIAGFIFGHQVNKSLSKK
jgi:4-hydroxybenzoate polyprenyltransferase